MSEKMQKREGVLGVVRDINRKFVLFPVPEEDVGKEERLEGEDTWVVITAGMLGSISEAVKDEDVVHNPFDPIVTAQKALARGAFSEYNFYYDENRLVSSPTKLDKRVEQRRRGNLVSFEVWICNLFLSQGLINSVSGSIALPTDEMIRFLEENPRNVRPSTFASVLKAIDSERRPGK